MPDTVDVPNQDTGEQPQVEDGRAGDSNMLGTHGQHADQAEADRGRPDSLLAQANTALILYPRFKELHADIRQCQRLSTVAGEAQCMSLEGPTGAGKSTLVQEYASAVPRVETKHGSCIPVLYLETPSPVTVKGLAAFMLETLGDPLAHKGAVWSMNSRLTTLLKACHVELVILDDFHHLLQTETLRNMLVVSDWLKVMIKATGIPFLTVGVEGKVEQVLKANPQLSRLFAVRETLRPFPWDTDGHMEAANKPGSSPRKGRPVDPRRSSFGQFVQYAEEVMGLPLVTPLDRIDLLGRLHYATDGVVANIMNLLRYAQEHALNRGGTAIELRDLSWAFDKRLVKHISKTNPFVDPQMKATLTSSASSAPSAPEAEYKQIQDPDNTVPERGGRPRKSRTNANEVLRAS
jgi:hypothetical protein